MPACLPLPNHHPISQTIASIFRTAQIKALHAAARAAQQHRRCSGGLDMHCRRRCRRCSCCAYVGTYLPRWKQPSSHITFTVSFHLCSNGARAAPSRCEHRCTQFHASELNSRAPDVCIEAATLRLRRGTNRFKPAMHIQHVHTLVQL